MTYNDNEFDELFESDYYRIADIEKGDVVLNIAEAEIMTLRDPQKGPTKKCVLTFSEGDAKRLVVNKSNYQYLTSEFGPASQWKGKTIALSAIKSPFGAGKMLCVREHDNEMPF